MTRWMLAFLAATAGAEAVGVTLAYTDGRPPVVLTSTAQGGAIYFRLDEVASGFNGFMSWIPGRRRAALIAGRDSISVTVDSRFVAANGHGLCLDHPVILAEGRILVPEGFLKAIPPLLNSFRASWIDSLGQLLVEGSECDIQLIRIVEDTVSVRVEMSIPSHASWVLSPFVADSMVLTLRGATVCAVDFDSLGTAEAPASIRARQESGRAVLVAHRAIPGIGGRCRASGSTLTLVLGPQEGLVSRPRPVRRLMIDAGHGGSDHGARAATGVAEKDVALTTASLLSTALQNRLRDVDVLVTRQDDEEIPHAVRVSRANAAGADLFVSLHCDWSFDRSRRGMRVSFSMPRQARGEAELLALDGVVAAVESFSRTGGGSPGPDSWDEACNGWVLASRDAAEAVTEAARAHGLRSSGPSQVPLGMLRGLVMPGIVIELGHLSNPAEARDLATVDYLESLVNALADGIARYVETSRSQGQS